MNILQNYWLLPLRPPNADGKEPAGPLGGWPHPRYHYFSRPLSCLLFRRYYEEVELVTDEAGKARLIDQLELPYTRVTTCLDDINHFPAPLWAMGKIHACRRQRQPFGGKKWEDFFQTDKRWQGER